MATPRTCWGAVARVVGAALLMASAGCGGGSIEGVELGDVDAASADGADAIGDAGADAEVAGDASPDGDADAGTDAEDDAEIAADSDVDSDAEVDADAAADADAANDAGDAPDSEIGADSDATPDAESDAETDAETDAAPDGDADAGSDATADADVTPPLKGEPPVLGDLLITELMIDPVGIPDSDGEWFEITSLSTAWLDLSGCRLHDDGVDDFALADLPALTTVAPGARLVFGPVADIAKNGGVPVGAVSSGLVLGNSSDALILSCSGVDFDRVAWNIATWPIIPGRALSLAPETPELPGANDSPGAWCPASTPYGGGNYGSPADVNPPCAELVDPCDPNPCTSPAAPVCDGGVARTESLPGTCVPENLAAVCTYVTAATDCVALGSTCDAGTCVGVAAAPAPGDVIFTEIMQNPAKVADTAGEWFELTNRSAETLELSGCRLESGGDAGHTIAAAGSVILAPGQLALFARNGVAAQNGGLDPAYIYAGVSLGNGADTLSLSCAGQLVDAVAYDGGPLFPAPNGASIALDPGAADAASNDAGASWCMSATPYGDGDFGTPGELNPPCPGPDLCAGVVCATAPPGACDGTVAIAFSAAGQCVAGACVYPTAKITDCADVGLLCEGGSCTDDPCVPNPCALPPPATCDGDLLIDHAGVGTCTTAGGSASCKYAAKPFDCAAFGGTCAAGNCDGVAVVPGPGDLVIAEMMVNPEASGDDEGEWFEVVSAAAGVVDLTGCVLRDKQDDNHVIAGSGPFLLMPGERALFGGSPTPELNGGYTPDYSYGGTVSLANAADELRLVCGDLLVDEVVYDVATWPIRPGKSIQLSPTAVSAAANDLASSWCASFFPYGDGDLGTPGAANPPCPTPNPVDRCRLDEPAVATILKGQDATFTGTLREAGLTTLTLGTDPTPLILVDLGTGPAGSNPSADATGWTFTSAAPDLSWSAAGVADVADDRYTASVSGSKVGAFDVALRVSVDGGLTWTWCDRDPETPGNDGSEDGYQPAQAGHLTVGATACDPNPCSAPPAASCDGEVLTTHPVPGACAIQSGNAVCTYSDVEVNCAALGGACAAGGCVGTAPKPALDEVAIVELMIDPAKVSDQSGEWIELANVSDHAVLLDGCVLEDLVGGETHTIAPATPLLLQPGAVALLGRSTDTLKNGGAAVQYAYGNAFQLSNTVDAVFLRCEGAIVTKVEFDDDLWPFGPGVAMQLDPSAFGAPGATSPDAWCAAYTPYGAGDLGTPGAPNPPCPTAALPDWCRLQLDAPLTAHAGTEVAVHGRVLKAGLTTLTAATDPNPLLLAQVGYGPQGSSPQTLTASWTFLAATPDATWLDSAEPGVDDYVATFLAPAPGTRDVAFRFSVNGGLSWLYCDRASGVGGEDGSENGYQTANAGSLTTTAGPCDPNPCATPPAPSCAGEVLTTWGATGTCTVVGDAPACAYDASTTDCAAAGGACVAGACEGSAEPPEVGAVVITELLRDPVAVSDALGEWVEIRNVGAVAVDLWGCVFGDDGTEHHVIDSGGPLLLAPGEHLVLGESDALELNGGVAVDYVYSGVTLANAAADEVVLSCAGDVIDRVAWAATGWPKAAGKALQLDPGALDAAQNDLAASWCNATAIYGSGDRGTPGSDNASCPVDPCAAVLCGATPAPSCSGGFARTFGDGGVCAAGVCQWPVASSVECAATGLVCLAGACVPAGAMPATGEVVVTELMVRPLAAAGAGGQWIELTSTVDTPLLIGGCALESAGDAPWPIPAGIVLAPGQRLVIGASADPSQNGGLATALAHGGAIALDADGDSVALTCDGTLIDGVSFDALDWPWSEGRSLSLDPSGTDAVANDTPGAWCLATTSYGLGDLGSPGQANAACPPLDGVDRCRLQAPDALSLLLGESALVAVRYTEAGLTDQGAGTDADVRLVVQLGRGPLASDPVVDADLWTLVDAVPNTAWQDAAAPGYDEAQALLNAVEVGSSSYAFRVSVDAGQSFVWCDRPGPGAGQDGSEDGYQAALAGLLNSVGDPCAPNPCMTPPPAECQGDVLVTPSGVGVCTPDMAGATCAFGEITTDCGALGGSCVAGACAGLSTVAGPGDVVFTEIMNDPVLTTDPNGEWLELTVVGPQPVDLSGCVLQSDGDADRVISAGVPLLVVPGLHVVFARKADPAVNGGVSPAWAWLTGLTLGQGADAVRLLCGGALIDAVAWDGGPAFPVVPGASMQLSVGATSATANDLGSSWCASKTAYGLGDLGSPGLPNASCP